MALPNSVRFAAIYAIALGCSSQSIEAVGVVSCLAAPERPACGSGGTGGTGGVGTTGGAATTGGAVATGGEGSGTTLIHRYSFDGSGVVAKDSVGGADGNVVNTTLDGAGAVSIADDQISDNQAADEFVDLPNQLISGLRSATLEAWVTWAGAGVWQRIFDFGDDTSGVEGVRSMGNGKTYLFLTTQTPADQVPASVLRVAYQADGIHEVRLDATRALPRNVKTHVAVVVDSDAARMLVYMNGELENSIAFPANRLARIHDVNNWLGRSNYFYDPGFTGTFHEFRVYSAALNAAEVRASFAAGSETPVPGL